MAFLKQLWLLLWKNSLLKRRSRLRLFGYSIPVSVLVEIFWPVFLYIIMAILRLQFKPEIYQDSIYPANALPSAGVLPFMQTLMCDIGQGTVDDPTDMPHYPNASVNDIYSVLDELGSWNGTWDSICSSIKTVADQSDCGQPVQWLNSSECSDPASLPLTCVLRDSQAFHDFLTGELGLDESTVESILTSHVNTEQPFGNPADIPTALPTGLPTLPFNITLPTGLPTALPSGLPTLPFNTTLPTGLPTALPTLPFNTTLPFTLPSEVPTPPPAPTRTPLKRQAIPTLPPTPGLEDSLLSPDVLRAIACDSQSLGAVLQFQPGVSVDNVSQALCGLSPAQWQQLSDELQRQVQLSPLCSSSAEQLREVYSLLALEDTLNAYSQLSDLSFDLDTESNFSIFSFLCGDERRSSGFLRGTLQRLSEGDKYRRAETRHEMEGSGAGSGAGSGSGEDEGNTPGTISLKVLYAPDNNLTRSIMTKANRTFATADYLQDWAEQVSNCSDHFLENYPPDSPRVERLRQTIDFLLYNDSASGVWDYLQNVGEIQNVTVTNASLFRVSELLNPNSTDNIWDILEQTRDTADAVLYYLSLFDWDVFLPVENETRLEELAGDYNWQQRNNITFVAAGIVFTNLSQEDLSLTSATFKIRMNSTFIHDTTTFRETVWRPGPEDEQWKRRYLEAWFIFFQDMVERALVDEVTGERVASPGVYLHQMPYPCYKKDSFTASLLFVLPLAMIFAWLFPVAMTTRGIVREKEVRLREFMKMMGLGEGVLRLSWFITSLAILSVSVAIITIILKTGNLLPHSDWSLVFFYLLLYAIVMISYCFLVSAFFTNANVAACSAALLYFMVFFAHVTVIPKQEYLSPGVLVILCLWAPLAFSLGATYLVQFELEQIGLQWYNMHVIPIQDDHLSFLVVMGMLIFDTFLYMVLTWYIEGVRPGKYGVAKPFYFPFMPSYWLGQRGRGSFSRRGGARHVTLQEEEETIELTPTSNQDAVCEDEPEHLTQGITIRNLSKTYSSGCRWQQDKWRLECKRVDAVKNLSLTFYEGQITAFLGHNGAGKTTTMSVLTGLFEPTSGTASIYGNDIRHHMDIIRQSLGICPQHNILFDNMTVEEHLLFYGQLKGQSWHEAKKQIPEWLAKVNLLAHAHKLSRHLSGGMKRKLSILLAFVGNSKTVILDEPTSGVDPFARRQIWDFLLRHRDDRTIMLSTHHMDEAELLGDRIAIISNGSLICCGSFEFLRRHFGRGHRLTLVTSSQSDRRSSTSSRTLTVTVDIEDTDHAHQSPNPTYQPAVAWEDGTKKISRFIQGYVTSAHLEEERGRELHFLLPLHQARPAVLAQLFAQLELQRGKLGVTSYGLSACSMEEIFIQLTERESQDQTDDPSDAMVPRRSSVSSTDSASIKPSPSEQGGGEAIDGDEESVFDEEGLLFGDTSSDDLLGSKETVERLTFLHLWLSQYRALLIKRFYYTRRRVGTFIVQNIFPIAIILLGLVISHDLQTVDDLPPLELSPDLFFHKSKLNYLFLGGNDTSETEQFLETLYRPCGVGAHVTGNPFFADKCGPRDVLDCTGSHDYPQDQFRCTCPNCTDSALFGTTYPPLHPPQCYNSTVTGTRLQNITTSSFNSEDPELAYQSLTAYLLRSKNSFIESRYGGLSFGHARDEIDPYVDILNQENNDSLPFFASHSAAKVWYSLKGYHAMPAFLNVMNNALLRKSLGPEADPLKYGIKTVNHPFSMTDLQKIFYSVTERGSFLVNPLAVIFALGFVTAGFVLILIEERSGNVKHLQLVCGMNRGVYWLSAFTWDLVNYAVFITVMLILFVIFQDIYFVTADVFPVFLVLLVAYGVSVTPWMYGLSLLFHSPATAYVTLFCLNFFLGFAMLIVDAIIIYVRGLAGNQDGKVLQVYLVAMPTPSYCLARAMMYLNADRPLQHVAASFTFQELPGAFSDIWPFILSLLLWAVVYTAILFVVEYLPLMQCKGCRNKTALPHTQAGDEAVQRERVKVMDGTRCHGDILTLRNVTKVYGSRVAVDQLCLSMEKAECFGLLGVNGAGKTTTFRMLTGDTHLTNGDALIASNSVQGSLGTVQQSIGYCPQVDALIDPLTGRQHLVLFCRLRGLPNKEVNRVVEWSLLKLGLMEYADKPAGAYSGGNRRKLSTAIALLARPPLIMLDEPTSGVDPRARRFLWSIIRGLVGAGQSVLLTTHSMMECEALCSRVGIMVNGAFCCLGSPQQLKSRYGEGYRLKIRVRGTSEPIKEFVRQNIGSAVLKEEHYNTLVYQLPPTNLQLSMVFETMERARESLDIEDYSLSQTTLDDVFIHFANQQNEEAGLLMQQGAGLEGETTPTEPLQLPDVVVQVSDDKQAVNYSVQRDSVSIN